MKNLIKLMRYTYKYKKNIFISITAMLLQVASGFVIPYLMITIIDDAIPNGNMNLLLMTSLYMILVALVGLVTGVVNNYNTQYISQYASADLRLDLFKKIQSFSFENIDNFKTSRLITSSTNDVVRVQQFFAMLFRIIVRAPLMIGVGIFMAIQTSAELSELYYISIPLLLITIIVIMIVAFPRFQKVQKTVDKLNKITLENANAPRVIKSFVSTNIENDKFNDANEEFRVINTSAEKVMAFAEPIIMFIFNATLGGIIYFGANIISEGGLINTVDGIQVPQVGVLMAFSNFSMQILFGLMMFAFMMIFISRASVSAKRINEVFDEEPRIFDNENPIRKEIEGVITFKNVSFGYQSESNLVIKDISFTVNKGETIGIIGSTGSGKSTLINLIPRLYDVQKGSVLIDDIDVREYDIANLRSQIGLVTQNPVIFSGSIGTNIMQGSNNTSYEEVKKASEYADSYEFIKEYDDLFNHEVLQKGQNLSGGQKQRVSLTRAFIRKPKILILDDSTSAVDAKSETFILSSIKKLSSNTTTLIISQKISTIKDMDKILVLNNDGKVDAFGTHNELLKESKVYQEIALSQVGYGGEDNE